MQIEATYDYRDARGDLLYQVVRAHHSNGKKTFWCRRPDSHGGWIKNLSGITPLPYRLPELNAAVKLGEAVYIPEGEKDVHSAEALGLVATTNHGGAGKWQPGFAEYVRGADVRIIPDNDLAGTRHAQQVAQSLFGVAAKVRIVELPGLPDKGDLTDWIDLGGTRIALERLAEHAPEYVPVAENDDNERLEHSGLDSKQQKQTVAARVIAAVLAEEPELFHSPDGSCLACIGLDGHRETHRIDTSAFKAWIGLIAFNNLGATVSSQTLRDVLLHITALARYQGKCHSIHTRVAESDGAIYLDIGDPEWRAVEVDSNGWRVISNPSVKFVRPSGMLPLPIPQAGGQIDDLRRFINLSDTEFRLFVSWLVAALRPTGPYPILALSGPRGAAKSTATRIARKLIDPNKAPLRSQPRDEHDLVIAASSGWVITLENCSSIAHWLSDALCRVATGGGFSTRKLFTDSDEVIFDVQRPAIINGIVPVITQGDLADRAVSLTLEEIREEDRKTERALWLEFDAVWPTIFGALLDILSFALKRLPATQLASYPRMADFAQFAAAAATAIGWSEQEFIQAYSNTRKEAQQSALESCPYLPALEQLVQAQEGIWCGSASDLLSQLNEAAGDRLRREPSWPKAANVLSAGLRRLQPDLRSNGMDISFIKSGRSGRQIRLELVPETIVPIVTTVTHEFTMTRNGDDLPHLGDDACTRIARRSSPALALVEVGSCVVRRRGDDGDDGGDPFPGLFDDEGEERL